jgi:hypothetical protein
MQSSTQSVPASSHAAETATQARSREDLIYQAVTVAAILLVLGSVWIF